MDNLVIGAGCFVLLVQLAVCAAIIFAVVHFVLKAW